MSPSEKDCLTFLWATVSPPIAITDLVTWYQFLPTCLQSQTFLQGQEDQRASLGIFGIPRSLCGVLVMGSKGWSEAATAPLHKNPEERVAVAPDEEFSGRPKATSRAASRAAALSAGLFCLCLCRPVLGDANSIFHWEVRISILFS